MVGGDFVVVVNSGGTVVSISVAQTAAIGRVGVTPKITATAAGGVAKTRLKVAAHAAPAIASPSASRLVVLAGPTPKLAWESEVTGITSDGPSKLAVYVDAATGSVLQQRERVLHAGRIGNSAYNSPNPVTIDTSGSGSSYSMTDPTRTNLACQDATNNKTFTGPDNSWQRRRQQPGNRLCRRAFRRPDRMEDARRMARPQWLHRRREGLPDPDRRPGGERLLRRHPGSGRLQLPAQLDRSIDVVAHEFGHSIDDHTPGGISGNGTQEFVPDTFGASTEWYANEPSLYDTPDFTVGEQINLVGNGPIRYTYQPSLAGDKNCYDSSVPGGEVHAAAGPGNHWFYLTAEGTSPTNGQSSSPTCNSSTGTGIGVQKAITIMYNAMLMKTSSASYLKCRTWTLTAVKNLYPGDCSAFNNIKAAWDAVSVPAPSGEHFVGRQDQRDSFRCRLFHRIGNGQGCRS